VSYDEAAARRSLVTRFVEEGEALGRRAGAAAAMDALEQLVMVGRALGLDVSIEQLCEPADDIEEPYPGRFNIDSLANSPRWPFRPPPLDPEDRTPSVPEVLVSVTDYAAIQPPEREESGASPVAAAERSQSIIAHAAPEEPPPHVSEETPHLSAPSSPVNESQRSRSLLRRLDDKLLGKSATLSVSSPFSPTASVTSSSSLRVSSRASPSARTERALLERLHGLLAEKLHLQEEAARLQRDADASRAEAHEEHAAYAAARGTRDVLRQRATRRAARLESLRGSWQARGRQPADLTTLRAENVRLRAMLHDAQRSKAERAAVAYGRLRTAVEGFNEHHLHLVDRLPVVTEDVRRFWHEQRKADAELAILAAAEHSPAAAPAGSLVELYNAQARVTRSEVADLRKRSAHASERLAALRAPGPSTTPPDPGAGLERLKALAEELHRYKQWVAQALTLLGCAGCGGPGPPALLQPCGHHTHCPACVTTHPVCPTCHCPVVSHAPLCSL